jgi:hypothetical protein
MSTITETANVLNKKTFLQNTNIPATLIDSIVDQLGTDWEDEDFIYTMLDVSRHGANCGFGGFIYYNETSQFYRENQSEIIDLLTDLADQMGQTKMDLVKGFRCTEDATEDEIAYTLFGNPQDHDTYVANCLAWFALETLANEISDFIAYGSDK